MMNTVAAIFVIIGILSSLIIMIDTSMHSQTMKIMNPVWILTGLWGGVLALVAYFWFGRNTTGCQNVEVKKETNHSYWKSVTLSTLHCGAGCTLANLIGECFLYFVVIKIAGSLLLGSVVIDYILALAIGVYFQYIAIKSMLVMKMPVMRGLSKEQTSAMDSHTMYTPTTRDTMQSMPEMQALSMPLPADYDASMPIPEMQSATTMDMPGMQSAPAMDASVTKHTSETKAVSTMDMPGMQSVSAMTHKSIITKAFKADVLSLTAWQVGMYGFMALVIFMILQGHIPPRTSWIFWFMMQLGMCTGFLLSFPVNVLLIKMGVKEAM